MKLISGLCLIFLVFSCKKDVVPEENPNVNPAQGTIYAVELMPDIELSSVDSMVWHPSGCGYVPSPADSSMSVSLDINGDGAMDFTLNCASWYQTVSSANACTAYHMSMTISATSSDNFVTVQGNYNAIERYNSGDTIVQNASWMNNGTLMLASATAPFSTNFSGPAYLGLKLLMPDGAHYGWLSVEKIGTKLLIYAHGYNELANDLILAGQTQ
jgi:hypothetical protein